MLGCGAKSCWNGHRSITVMLIVVCVGVGTPAAHAEFAVSSISFQFAWGVAGNPEAGYYLFFEGRFTKATDEVTLIAYNPKTGEKKTLLDGVALAAGKIFQIDRSHGWAWVPGERLAVMVGDQDPVIIDAPLQGSFDWKLALDYSVARARGAGLAARPLGGDDDESSREKSRPSAPSAQEQSREASREYAEFQRWIASVQAQQMQQQWNRTFGTMPSPGMDDDFMSPYGPMTSSPGPSLPQDITCPLCNGTRFYGKTAAPNYGYGPTTYVDTPCPRCGGAGHVSR